MLLALALDDVRDAVPVASELRIVGVDAPAVGRRAFEGPQTAAAAARGERVAVAGARTAGTGVIVLACVVTRPAVVFVRRLIDATASAVVAVRRTADAIAGIDRTVVARALHIGVARAVVAL